MTATVIPLGELTRSPRAIVVGYNADQFGIRRFAEMGLIPGTEVSALNVAPRGDPIEYAVAGARLSIRREDARAVMVEVCH